MTPKNQNRRLLQIGAFGTILCIGALGVFSALNQNAQFFYNPSDVVRDGFIAESDAIKIGGLVLPNSIVKGDGILTEFRISDFPVEGQVVKAGVIKVTYEGILPDLFAEGDGVVVTGELIDENYLEASEVLAKHDENYQPVKN